MNKKRKLIKELLKRRDEVINRGKNLVAGNLPESLIDSGRFIDMVFWIIEPHVSPTFTEYKVIDNEQMRKARLLSDKILTKCGSDICEKETE